MKTGIQLCTYLLLCIFAGLLLADTALDTKEPPPQSIDSSAISKFIDREFVTGDIRLVFTEGADNGPPLVFLPGMGVKRQSFMKTASILMNSFHVFMVDMRGHGDSARAGDAAYRVSDFGEDIAALVRDYIKEPIIVSGHSSGGLVALWLASKQPELVIGMVAEDPPLLNSEMPGWKQHWLYPAFVALEQRLLHYQLHGNPDEVTNMFAESRLTFPRHDMSFERRIIALGKLLNSLPGNKSFKQSEYEKSRRYAAYQQYLNGQAPRNGDFWPYALQRKIATGSLHLDPAIVTSAVTGQLNEGFDHMTALSQVRAPSLYLQSDQEILGHISHDEVSSMISMLGRYNRAQLIYAEYIGHRIHNEAPELFAESIHTFFLDSKGQAEE